jgi:hypothetical protein
VALDRVLSQLPDEAKPGREADVHQRVCEWNRFAAVEAGSLMAPSWPLRIMRMTAMPAIRILAQRKVFNPLRLCATETH